MVSTKTSNNYSVDFSLTNTLSIDDVIIIDTIATLQRYIT